MFCTAKTGEFFPYYRGSHNDINFFPPNSGYLSELINDGMGERDEGKRLILNGRHKRSGDKDALTDIT